MAPSASRRLAHGGSLADQDASTLEDWTVAFNIRAMFPAAGWALDERALFTPNECEIANTKQPDMK